MPVETPPPPPRRKWIITRWLLVFGLVAMAWSGWRVYAFRAALAEAKALGWVVAYTDPGDQIWNDWKAAFKKETWLDGVRRVDILKSEAFEQHLAIVHRLNPKALQIDNAATLRDLSALKPLNRVQMVWLVGCTALTNVDALQNLPALKIVYLTDCTGLTNVDGLKKLSALERVYLNGCTGLTNVDALKNLSALQQVDLNGCTGLTNVDVLKNLSALSFVALKGCTGLTRENVAALKAALPKTRIFGP